MTEFEINKKVAHKIGVEDDYGTFTPLKKYSFDPCNNVEQAWEIMLAHDISVVRNICDDSYDALYNLDIYTKSWNGCVSHKKPFVAAMLLFLEV